MMNKDSNTIKLDKYGNELTRINALTQSYKSFRFKNEKFEASVSEMQYKVITQMFIEKMFNMIVKNGYKFHLPYSLGAFEVIQVNQLELKKYFEMQGKKYYVNENNKGDAFQILNKPTKGCWWKFKWFKPLNRKVVKNLRKYVIKLVRSNVRASSNKDYSKSTNRLNITDFYLKEGYKLYREIDVKWFKHYRAIKEEFDNKIRLDDK